MAHSQLNLLEELRSRHRVAQARLQEAQQAFQQTQQAHVAATASFQKAQQELALAQQQFHGWNVAVAAVEKEEAERRQVATEKQLDLAYRIARSGTRHGFANPLPGDCRDRRGTRQNRTYPRTAPAASAGHDGDGNRGRLSIEFRHRAISTTLQSPYQLDASFAGTNTTMAVARKLQEEIRIVMKEGSGQRLSLGGKETLTADQCASGETGSRSRFWNRWVLLVGSDARAGSSPALAHQMSP